MSQAGSSPQHGAIRDIGLSAHLHLLLKENPISIQSVIFVLKEIPKLFLNTWNNKYGFLEFYTPVA